MLWPSEDQTFNLLILINWANEADNDRQWTTEYPISSKLPMSLQCFGFLPYKSLRYLIDIAVE